MSYGYSNPFAPQPQKKPLFGADLPSLAQGGATSASQPRNPGLMQAIGNFANSPGGAALIQGAGGFLAGMGQNRQLEADRQLRASDSMQRGYEFEVGRSKEALAADPLGATNQYAAKQAFLNQLLPTLRNAQVTPPSDIAAQMPQMTGGLRLPEGGIDPEALKAYSPGATAEAIARREQDLMRLDPNRRSASPMLNELGLNVNGVGNSLNEFQNAEQQRQLQQREAIRRALDNDIQGQKKKGGIWGKLGKIALGAGAGLVAPLTGGASLASLPAILGASTGAASQF